MLSLSSEECSCTDVMQVNDHHGFFLRPSRHNFFDTNADMNEMSNGKLVSIVVSWFLAFVESEFIDYLFYGSNYSSPVSITQKSYENFMVDNYLGRAENCTCSLCPQFRMKLRAI